MKRPGILGSTISTIAIAAALTGCATGPQSRQSQLSSKADREKVGLATRAQVALASQQYATAVELAEKAVEYTPNDAGFRALLGNCYFAAGRFASAEAAYTDALSLSAVQPQVVLKLALVQIAQGKNGEALSLLNSAAGMLDPADFGLAVALAGQPDAAVTVLDVAARQRGADSRVRQNLALAYGLAGDWVMARTVAAQDVPPDQVDTRVQQWMAMAVPTRPSDQVAALTGVTPAADPGQPQRLALNAAPKGEAYAEAAVPQPAPQPVEVQTAATPALPEAMPAPMPPVAVAEAEVKPNSAFMKAAKSLLETPPAVAADKPVQASSAEVPEMVPAVADKAERSLPTTFADTATPASFVAVGNKASGGVKGEMSRSVVQLGAYSSRERVAVAWERLSKRYPALAHYTPMSARFDGPNGTVWRLSIKGFESQREASNRCQTLKSRGGACFVRQAAGDSPVQVASR